MDFEWDPEKHQANRAKHGVGFDDASRIFEGRVLEKIDNRRDYGEQRIAAVGVVNGLELFVAYTWRGSRRRIISARRANKHEKQAYWRAE
jgi:uncharacterized DUF497 family protein